MFTDIHSHVIWGVDDGAQTREETCRMLREAVTDGIDTIICTPHMMPGIQPFPEETYQAHLREARDYILQENLLIRLLEGAEIFYTEHTARFLREKKIHSLAGSEFVLVEFCTNESRDKICEAIRQIAGTGYRPVIAHLERYAAFRTTAQVREIRERYGVLTQINARSLIRRQPLLRRKYFDGLFQESLVDFVATDTHALPGRNTCMTEGIRVLGEKFGPELAERIEKNSRVFFVQNIEINATSVYN